MRDFRLGDVDLLLERCVSFLPQGERHEELVGSIQGVRLFSEGKILLVLSTPSMVVRRSCKQMVSTGDSVKELLLSQPRIFLVGSDFSLSASEGQVVPFAHPW